MVCLMMELICSDEQKKQEVQELYIHDWILEVKGHISIHEVVWRLKPAKLGMG